MKKKGIVIIVIAAVVIAVFALVGNKNGTNNANGGDNLTDKKVSKTETYFIEEGAETLYEYYEYEDGLVIEHWIDANVISENTSGTEYREIIEYDAHDNPTYYTYSGDNEYYIVYENEYDGNLLTAINESIFKNGESQNIVCVIEYNDDKPVKYNYYINESEDAVVLAINYDENDLISSLSIEIYDYLWNIDFAYENELLTSYSVTTESSLNVTTAKTLTDLIICMNLYSNFSNINVINDNLTLVLAGYEEYYYVEYEYNDFGDLTETIYPNLGTTNEIQYEYDENGNIIQATSSDETLVTYYTY